MKKNVTIGLIILIFVALAAMVLKKTEGIKREKYIEEQHSELRYNAQD